MNYSFNMLFNWIFPDSIMAKHIDSEVGPRLETQLTCSVTLEKLFDLSYFVFSSTK